MKLNSSYFFALGLILFFSTTSCSRVDADPTIEGVWEVQSLTMDVVTLDFDTREVYATVPCNYDASSPNQNIDADTRLIINADKTGSLIFSGECVETFEFDFEWTFDLDRIFRMERTDGSVTTWYIVQLTHDRVSLQFTREDWNLNVTPRLITRREYSLEFSRL